jgi:hypothetical protein
MQTHETHTMNAETLVLSCGHRPSPHDSHTTGTARIPMEGGARAEVCWSCADDHIRGLMRSGAMVVGYLSEDGKSLTSWSGGKLADVTGIVERRGVGFGGGTRTYWSAIGEGRKWYGSSTGRGMVTTMRARKS